MQFVIWAHFWHDMEFQNEIYRSLTISVMQYGHDLVALGLEHVRSSDPFILKAREHLLIKKFDSYRNGLNQEP